jgi:hypothetical protein
MLPHHQNTKARQQERSWCGNKHEIIIFQLPEKYSIFNNTKSAIHYNCGAAKNLPK